MDKKKTSLSKDVEDTMACSAFAEAGEPCPVDEEKKTDEPEEDLKSSHKTVEETMACTAFAEAGEPCPVDEEKKTDAQENEKD